MFLVHLRDKDLCTNSHLVLTGKFLSSTQAEVVKPFVSAFVVDFRVLSRKNMTGDKMSFFRICTS